MTTHDHEHRHQHKSAHDEHGKHPRTAADEVLHAAEEAETTVVDGGERRGKDREAADALTPNEDAQDDVQRRDRRDS
ncbi:hypothetical protein ACIOKD_02855 [Streptomyces sp. NPDC087844]|uniref:hypothetical protein n=1 Tax=Streptomyces sp. NPDC087844 TaxID=3365805 RepID=UPI00380C2687